VDSEAQGGKKGFVWWVAVGLAVAAFLYVLYVGLRKYPGGGSDG
jgi:hypothetical protein